MKYAYKEKGLGAHRLWKLVKHNYMPEGEPIQTEQRWELLWDGVEPTCTGMVALATSFSDEQLLDPLSTEDIAVLTLKDPVAALIATLDVHGLVRSWMKNERGMITKTDALLPILMKQAAMQLKLQGVGPTEDCLIQGNAEVKL